jgi:hypothetical protein
MSLNVRKTDLTTDEITLLKSLSTPMKVQDYLDTLAINHEKKGETCMSPRRVIQSQKAHCIEGAMLAAVAFWMQGEKPLLMDLKSMRGDYDHVIVPFRQGGRWGAISKTNHVALRWRDPIYVSIRELAASYFHEYFLDSGVKTLRSYSGVFSLAQFGTEWITTESNLWNIASALDHAPHFLLYPEENRKYIRNADLIERDAGKIIEWHKKDAGT